MAVIVTDIILLDVFNTLGMLQRVQQLHKQGEKYQTRRQYERSIVVYPAFKFRGHKR